MGKQEMIASQMLAQSRLCLRCTRGVAAIEFGLVAPILLMITVVGMELVNYVVTHHQVRSIAAMTADNASRVRTQMSEAYVNQLFLGVKKAGDSIKFEDRGRVILSSVQNNTPGTGQWLRWQRCFGKLVKVSDVGIEGKGETDKSLLAVSGLAAQPGSAIMYAEVFYNYTPLIPNGLWTGERISHQIAFIVRQRTDFAIAGTLPSKC